MKTCPNPNCKTSGIPDEANYCPVCGSPILSPKQLKKQKKERMNRLRKEAEQAWEAYPEKPLPKRNPYSLLWKILLLFGIICGIIIYHYLMDEYGITGDVVPEWIVVTIQVLAVIVIYSIIIFAVKSCLFNPYEEIDVAKERFIANYISEHEEK